MLRQIAITARLAMAGGGKGPEQTSGHTTSTIQLTYGPGKPGAFFVTPATARHTTDP